MDQTNNLALFTEVELPKQQFSISHKTPLMLIGSCFTDNIGQLLAQNKFSLMKNPFGVVYNPMSIRNSIKAIIDNRKLKEGDLVFHNHLWHSFLFHSTFSNANASTLVSNANLAIERAHTFLQKSEYLMVTFGTAFVYAEKESGQIVSNCHKLPEKSFNRYLLNKESIVDEWLQLISDLHQINPLLKIIFTISPVRHLRDGAHGNQLSKATLLLAVDEIIKRSVSKNIGYFPAYEIVMDELRDYRFYAEDMLHVSKTAVEIIFNRFGKCFFNKDTVNCIHEIEKISRAKEHRLLTDNFVEINRFAKQQLDKVEKIKSQWPEIDLVDEIQYFEGLIK